MNDTQTEVVELYSGEIRINFNNRARNRYLVTIGEDSHAPLGVTSVLNVLSKPALMLWPLNEAMTHLRATIGLLIANDELDGDSVESLFVEAEKAYIKKGNKGKDIGTIVHGWIENFLKHDGRAEILPLEKEARKACVAFEKWFHEVKPKILAVEQIVYSRSYDYAGKFDCLLELDGKKILCDIKTSNSSRTAPMGIYPEYFLQLGGYAKAYEEEGGVIDDVMVINCNKQGKVSAIRASELGLKVNDLKNGFLQALHLYRIMQNLGSDIKEFKAEELISE